MLFLYREVLDIDLPWLDKVVRAKQPAAFAGGADARRRCTAILDRVTGTHGLMARLLYGTGMRLMECVRLRVKDVDFERAEIVVRDGKGAKDRVTMLPQALIGPLQDHLRWRRQLFGDDKAKGRAAVYLPDALGKKYPNAAVELALAVHFPVRQFSVDPRSGEGRRHHIDEKLCSAR